MITFPLSAEEASAALAEKAGAIVRAGGTDLSERRRHQVDPPPLVDLRDVSDLAEIGEQDGGLLVGAGLRIAALAEEARIVEGYPGLAAAAGGLATPQIRAVATLGGNLLQRNRCWYYRHADFNCLKKGGSSCYAREGDHLYHSAFDLGPCLAPHPSTLGMALLAYEASVISSPGGERSVADLYGDGSHARSDNLLPAGALLTAVKLPPPQPGEQAAYLRAIARARAEWPLVEVLARIVVEDGVVRFARIALGGVAPVPLRATAVEEALIGQPAEDAAFAAAAAKAVEGKVGLEQTRYKLDLIPGTIRATLARAVAGAVVPAPPPPPEPEPEPEPAQKKKKGR